MHVLFLSVVLSGSTGSMETCLCSIFEMILVSQRAYNG